MKLFALLFVCLIALSSVNTAEVSLFEPIESAIEKHFPIEEVKDIYDCLVEGKDAVTSLVDLGVQIAAEDYPGAAYDGYKVVKAVIDMSSSCKVLFCEKPSIQKCEAAHQQGCEETGLFIYPKCAEGYTNWGCCVCASVCPEGFRDDGLFCAKPGAYGRGVGYAIWNKDKCERENSQGCEKNGLIWYPKCKEGFHNVGCCICSPNCPEGWTDIGVSCQKPHSYGRGAGYPLHFGIECIKEHWDENKIKLSASEEYDCEDLRHKVSILSDLVKHKMALQVEGTHQYALGDQVNLLTGSVRDYLQYCHVDKEQKE